MEQNVTLPLFPHWSTVEFDPDLTSSLNSYTDFPYNETDFLRHDEIMRVNCVLAPWVDKIVTPFWYVVGIIGNTISACIWLQQRTRGGSSSAVYLSSLSISDTIFLLLHILFELTYAWELHVLDYPGICETFAITYIVSQYLAPVLVLGFTIDRYIAVKFPFRKVVFCTVRKAFYTVCLLVLLCFGLGGIQGYLWTYDYGEKKCKVRKETYADGSNQSLWVVWSWLSEMLIFLVVPLIVLFINILVIREIKILSGRTTAEAVVQDGSTARRSAPFPRTNTNNSLVIPTCYNSEPLLPPLPPTTRDTQRQLSSPARNFSLPDGAIPLNSYLRNGHATRKVQSSHSQDPGGFSSRKSLGLSDVSNIIAVASPQRRRAPASVGNAATNVMLLTVSFYLILMTLPATIVYLITPPSAGDLNMSQDEISGDPTWQYYFLYHTTRKVVDEICISHYACNLFLFLVTGERFRCAFVAFFRRGCRSRDRYMSWTGNGRHGASGGNGYNQSGRGELLVQQNTVSAAI